jgi:very-short-patch-repair endonuclease
MNLPINPDTEIAKRCLLQDRKYWMSQSRMADLFLCRLSSLNTMLSTLGPGETEGEIRIFTLRIPQGRMTVNKKVIHYGMPIVYNLAIRKKAVDLLPRIQTLMPPGTVVPVAPRPEYGFGIELEKVLEGIASVERQKSFPPYCVDFYLPDFHIAVEHDGDYHKDPAVQMSDLDREVELQNEYGLNVIRVPYDNEAAGLNAILRYILRAQQEGFLPRRAG